MTGSRGGVVVENTIGVIDSSKSAGVNGPNQGPGLAQYSIDMHSLLRSLNVDPLSSVGTALAACGAAIDPFVGAATKGLVLSDASSSTSSASASASVSVSVPMDYTGNGNGNSNTGAGNVDGKLPQHLVSPAATLLIQRWGLLCRSAISLSLSSQDNCIDAAVVVLCTLLQVLLSSVSLALLQCPPCPPCPPCPSTLAPPQTQAQEEKEKETVTVTVTNPNPHPHLNPADLYIAHYSWVLQHMVGAALPGGNDGERMTVAMSAIFLPFSLFVPFDAYASDSASVFEQIDTSDVEILDIDIDAEMRISISDSSNHHSPDTDILRSSHSSAEEIRAGLFLASIDSATISAVIGFIIKRQADRVGSSAYQQTAYDSEHFLVRLGTKRKEGKDVILALSSHLLSSDY